MRELSVEVEFGAAQPLKAVDYRDLVRRALAEDLAGDDITTNAIVGQADRAPGTLLAKARACSRGSRSRWRRSCSWTAAPCARCHFKDGDECPAGRAIGDVTGTRPSAALGRAHGAEFSAAPVWYRDDGARSSSGPRAGAITILDTRKTTPTLRALEKYAVRMGGATNHRMSLNDGVLIKDNHIRVGGGIERAVAQVRLSGSAPSLKSRWRR